VRNGGTVRWWRYSSFSVQRVSPRVWVPTLSRASVWSSLSLSAQSFWSSATQLALAVNDSVEPESWSFETHSHAAMTRDRSALRFVGSPNNIVGLAGGAAACLDDHVRRVARGRRWQCDRRDASDDVILVVRRARSVQLDAAVMGVWGIGVSSLPWQATRLSGLLG